MQVRLIQGLLATAVAAFVWWRTSVIDGPFLFYDEFCYVAVSRWLAGPLTPELVGPLCHPGYGLVLTPLAATVKDPAQFHAWATFLNAATVGVIFLAVTALGTRLKLDPIPRMATSVVACTGSAIVLLSGMLIPEALLTLACAVSVLATWRLFETPSARWGAAVGLSLTVAYLTHPRAIVLYVAFLLVVAVSAITGELRRGHSVAVAIAALGYFATSLLTDLVKVELYAQVSQTDTRFLIENTLNNPILTAKAIFGTVWYLTASTFGLTIWGFAGAMRMALRSAGAARSTAQFVVLSVAGSLALSGMFTAGILSNPERSRPDVITYGRYVEQWLPVLIIFGVAELLRQWRGSNAREPWAALTVGLTALALVAGPLVFASFGPETRSGPTAISNSSALGWFWFQTGDLDLTRWAWVAAPVVLVATIAGRFRYWLPLVATFFWAQLAIGSTVNDWARPAAESWEQRGRIDGADITSPFIYEPDANPLAIIGLQYWQPELDVEVVIALDD